MSDARIRELELAVARGDPGALEALHAAQMRAQGRDPRVDPAPGDEVEWITRLGPRKARRYRFVVDETRPPANDWNSITHRGLALGWRSMPDMGRGDVPIQQAWDLPNWRRVMASARILKIGPLPPPAPPTRGTPVYDRVLQDLIALDAVYAAQLQSTQILAVPLEVEFRAAEPIPQGTLVGATPDGVVRPAQPGDVPIGVVTRVEPSDPTRVTVARQGTFVAAPPTPENEAPTHPSPLSTMDRARAWPWIDPVREAEVLRSFGIPARLLERDDHRSNYAQAIANDFRFSPRRRRR